MISKYAHKKCHEIITINWLELRVWLIAALNPPIFYTVRNMDSFMIWLVVLKTWPILHLPAATNPWQSSPLSKDLMARTANSKTFNSCRKTTTRSDSKSIKVTSGKSRGQLSLPCKTDEGQEGWLRREMSRAPDRTTIHGDRMLRRHKPAVRAELPQQMVSEGHLILSLTLGITALGAVLVLSIARLRVGRPRLLKLSTRQTVDVDIWASASLKISATYIKWQSSQMKHFPKHTKRTSPQ